jgi:ABC-2 type transport system ATP-binding protein
MSSPVYHIEKLTKTYNGGRIVANDAIDLEVRPGELFGLLGPNGAGKSTLVRQMVGLLKPDSGTILLHGRDITRDASWVPRIVSFLGQKPVALFDLTVREAIEFSGRLRHLSMAEARRQAAALMDEFVLSSCADQLVARLSGGEHRLVGLAVALIGHLPVLILDEPTNELDPAMRRVVWAHLQRLQREEGATIVLVTHNVLEAEQVVERVAIIRNGRRIALGTPGELKALVDRRIRLELLFHQSPQDCLGLLRQLGTITEVSASRCVLLVEREHAQRAIDRILAEVTLEALDDFRILTPSLEDVYLQLGGRERATALTATPAVGETYA